MIFHDPKLKKRRLETCSTQDLDRLSAQVGRGRLRRHQRAPPAARSRVETRHRPLQQVSKKLQHH